MWLKSDRESKMKSFLTKVFPFLKRNKRWRENHLGRAEDVADSKWSFISTTTADVAEFDETHLLGSVPNNKNNSRGCHGYVDWLPSTGSGNVANQNARLENGSKKNAKKFKLKTVLRKRKRPSSEARDSLVKVDKRLVDDVNKEASDNRVNEELICRMATPSERAHLLKKDKTGASKDGSKDTTRRSQNETEKRRTKSKDRVKRKRRRSDNYVAIEDENGLETVRTHEDVSRVRLGGDCPDQSDQPNWNAAFDRQISDSVWYPDTIAACQRPTEARQQTAVKNKSERLFRIKPGKGRKKLLPSRYEKMQSSVDQLDLVTRTTSRRHQHRTKQVKGRMWRICRSGWKSMKSGLIYYSKAPTTSAGFSPVLRRYEDGFEEFKDMQID